MAKENVDLWVSAGSFSKPYYRFYTDSNGDDEFVDLILELDKSYTFKRLDEAVSSILYIRQRL